MKNAHAFPEIYRRLGIDLSNLGCLMLNTAKPYVNGSSVPVEDEYYSPDPKKFWMNGLADNWHVTVRYGFLPGVSADDIDTVLAGITLPPVLYVDRLETFPSPYPNEEYECLVARVDSAGLRLMNDVLSVLPNVNTFVEYKPHITIGYFKKGRVPDLPLKWEVETLGLDYGHNMPRL